eukprot:TRINITY_DN11001_c0_g1_i1.p1 TRINITY_DN11001_c0_g1~~TRINITY_DN11001_c0_g1_i1.p1  ORF type:complete len:482 (+),score=124.27 TRINITY_DN11001_c0_g1_i1:103-1548(+)
MLLLLVMISIGLVSADTSTRDKRSTDNLEYVIRVLEEQGRLDEVDPKLLERIQATVQKTKTRGGKLSDSGINLSKTTPRTSVLDRARIRQQQLFGVRPQSRPLTPSPQSQPRSAFPDRNRLFGGECQALKTENSILKQQLLAAQSQFEEPARAQNILRIIQESSDPSPPNSQPLAANPLAKLLQASSKENDHGQVGIQLSSILITPTPTISTILDTTSFVTTVTVTLSKEIGIYFHGKRIPTHILDTEVQVQTVTSTISSTVEITPTPTWQTITITPTVTQAPLSLAPAVPNINILLAMKRQEQERKSLINKLQLHNNNRHEQPRSFGGFKAEVVEIPKTLDSFESLKKYLGNIRKLKQEQLPTIVAEPLIAIPTTSISTIYMSGSVPGQYSTSLITITLDEEGNPLDRRRREVSPSLPQPVIATQLAEVGEDNPINISDVELLSSFGEEDRILGNHREMSAQCSGGKVTVTVTKTRTCLP